MKKRAAVGMSGGTDSSVAAALLVEHGYEVIGLTAHMWKDGSRCCSLEDVARAQKVCAALGIRHYVVNAQDRFEEKVVAPFVSEYAAGRTPSPCIFCNQFIKFGFLLDRAAQLDCDILATGHYARIEERDGIFHLLRAADRTKDQSYFLHRLSQKQLARIAFPLGGWTKEQVKKWSVDHSLPIVPRGESQDLCFVEAGKYAEFIEDRAPEVKRTGQVLDTVCWPNTREFITLQSDSVAEPVSPSANACTSAGSTRRKTKSPFRPAKALCSLNVRCRMCTGFQEHFRNVEQAFRLLFSLRQVRPTGKTTGTVVLPLRFNRVTAIAEHPPRLKKSATPHSGSVSKNPSSPSLPARPPLSIAATKSSAAGGSDPSEKNPTFEQPERIRL
ncbi:MAG: 7-cyano-7-deazaguanine synthase [Pontiellaceae bacterium]|nr:7-cyano-7-deazaguanine synthase [Pontiellaceae bacterium]